MPCGAERVNQRWSCLRISGICPSAIEKLCTSATTSDIFESIRSVIRYSSSQDAVSLMPQKPSIFFAESRNVHPAESAKERPSSPFDRADAVALSL